MHASGHVRATTEEVFAFLGDLENHWRLLDRWTEILALDGDRATVRVRGPLGLRRTATTRLLERRAPERLVGEARAGDTLSRVTWTLAPDGDGTDVHLELSLDRATARDRLLLGLGGGVWLRRRLEEALARLDRLV